MAEREDARDAVERRAEVVAVALLGRPAVQRHAHPQRTRRAPRFGVQRALRGQRGGERSAGVGEDRVDAIADRFEDHATRAPRSPGAGWRRGAPGLPASPALVLLPQLRAAFNIGEQEGERAGR